MGTLSKAYKIEIVAGAPGVVGRAGVPATPARWVSELVEITVPKATAMLSPIMASFLESRPSQAADIIVAPLGDYQTYGGVARSIEFATFDECMLIPRLRHVWTLADGEKAYQDEVMKITTEARVDGTMGRPLVFIDDVYVVKTPRFVAVWFIQGAVGLFRFTGYRTWEVPSMSEDTIQAWRNI